MLLECLVYVPQFIRILIKLINKHEVTLYVKKHKRHRHRHAHVKNTLNLNEQIIYLELYCTVLLCVTCIIRIIVTILVEGF